MAIAKGIAAQESRRAETHRSLKRGETEGALEERCSFFGIRSPLRESLGSPLLAGAGAAGPRLHGVAYSGGEPTDRPQPGGAAREQGMAFVTKLGPAKDALASATLADEYAFLLSHNGGG
jgi:hypothetical protein